MTTIALTDLIDAIAADVEGNCDLPAHHRRLYAEPVLVTPDLTPMFAVYAWEADHDPMTTDAYTRTHHVRVGWAVDATFALETGGVGVEEQARAQLAVCERITARLMTYLAAVPGTDNQLEGTVTKTTWRAVGQGALWRYEAHLRIEDLGA
jgi:hypothetical protein